MDHPDSIPGCSFLFFSGNKFAKKVLNSYIDKTNFPITFHQGKQVKK